MQTRLGVLLGHESRGAGTVHGGMTIDNTGTFVSKSNLVGVGMAVDEEELDGEPIEDRGGKLTGGVGTTSRPESVAAAAAAGSVLKSRQGVGVGVGVNAADKTRSKRQDTH
eukprot:GILJ01017512.1.p2 GENE.GILJ01017512.1~~GILJ01017512.1.p2  ORF type:complete len:111 (-),score=18.61 GILJ01017512.1:230-562(-)